MMDSTRRNILGFASTAGALAIGSPMLGSAAAAQSGGSTGPDSDRSDRALPAGLFTEMAGASVPADIELVQTAGYAEPGRGAARYAYDAAIDPAFVVANPRTAFVTRNGRGFRLAETVRTPFMFGALGADPADPDASTDDTAALQAFFDDAFEPARSSHRYDWSGAWAVSAPLYAGRALGSGRSKHQYLAMHMGALHVLPVARQPNRVPMETVLTIVGIEIEAQGKCSISDGSEGQRLFSDRRFNNGVHIVQCAQGRIESISVNSAMRSGVLIDGSIEPWEIRTGSGFSTGSTSKNNIGLQIDRVYAQNCGSMNVLGDGRGLRLPIVSAVRGSDPSFDYGFSAVPESEDSHAQRTRITTSSTRHVRQKDFGRVRMEIPASRFTRIAADHARGKILWSSGDPVAAGLKAGDRIVLEDAGGGARNAGTQFEILGFEGDGNRALLVYPRPVDEPAWAYSKLVGAWSCHEVIGVHSETEFSVFPYLPSTANSHWHHISGCAVDVYGSDAANVGTAYVGAHLCGIGLRSYGLYAHKVDNTMIDVCDIGVVHGWYPTEVCWGLTIDHSHIEATVWNLVQATWNGTFHINGGSNFWPDQLVRLAGGAPRGTYIHNGRYLEYGAPPARAGEAVTLSNDPWHDDAVYAADSGSVSLDYDAAHAKLTGRASAEILLVGPTGGAPTGSFTFDLSAQLGARGWTIAGANPVGGFATPAKVRVFFDQSNRRAVLIRFNAA